MEKVRKIKEQRRKTQVHNEYFKMVKGRAINNYARKIGICWSSSEQTGTSLRNVKSMIPHFRGGKEREVFTTL